MQKDISPKTTALVFSVMVVLFSVAFYAFGWTEPTAVPPGGNASTSVNIGPTAQLKIGALGINGVLSAYNTISMNSTKITNLAEPTDNSDAATKGYVDAKLGGGGGGGGGLSFYQTTGTYNGANADTACAAGYHMCLIDEQIGRSYSPIGVSDNLDNPSWIDTNSNILSVQASSYCVTDYRADCGNWSATGSAMCGGFGPMPYIGRTVQFGNTDYDANYEYSHSSCSNSLPVLCCENSISEIGAEQAAAAFAAAATYCRNLGGSWHLPSTEELVQYVGITGATANYLWTSTHSMDSVGINRYAIIKLTDGSNYVGAPSNSNNFRCVR